MKRKYISMASSEIEKYKKLFEEKAYGEPNTGCWLWSGRVNRDGYGQLRLHGNAGYYTHRLSYEIFKGEIPHGLSVCHTCDVRCCVNPQHLFAGTHKENMADAARKGRLTALSGAPEYDRKGESNPFAKLDNKSVAEIKGLLSSDTPVSAIARLYAVSRAAIYAIKNRETWV